MQHNALCLASQYSERKYTDGLVRTVYMVASLSVVMCYICYGYAYQQLYCIWMHVTSTIYMEPEVSQHFLNDHTSIT